MFKAKHRYTDRSTEYCTEYCKTSNYQVIPLYNENLKLIQKFYNSAIQRDCLIFQLCGPSSKCLTCSEVVAFAQVLWT